MFTARVCSGARARARRAPGAECGAEVALASGRSDPVCDVGITDAVITDLVITCMVVTDMVVTGVVITDMRCICDRIADRVDHRRGMQIRSPLLRAFVASLPSLTGMAVTDSVITDVAFTDAVIADVGIAGMGRRS